MEEKERYSYDYFIDGAVFIDTENDRDMDMDTVCSLLNKQDKCIKELEKENQQLKHQLALTEKELDYAIFELDFARNHSQSTDSETLERIDKLRNKILNKAKESEKDE